MCIACETLLNKKWICSPSPREPGVHVLHEDLQNLVPYIDWKYFLYAWGFPLSMKIIEENSERGYEAKKLLNEAKEFLKKIIENEWCKAKAVFGIFPVKRFGDDVIIYNSIDIDNNELEKIHFLRQQTPIENSSICHSLVDYLSPKNFDWLGFFALSAGLSIEPHLKEFRKNNDWYNAMLLETLSGRLTEAYSEKLHNDVMSHYWGYAPHKKWGIRPSIGYPSIPDHSEKLQLWNILDVEKNIGVKLTDSYMMTPLNSACGYYFAHPKSKYFSVGKVCEDQLEDYANRKKVSLNDLKQFLVYSEM